jgi:transcriptional regulator NrdR family protein
VTRVVPLPDPHVCPRGHATKVIECRGAQGYFRRRRACPICGIRWTTYETTLHPRKIQIHQKRG